MREGGDRKKRFQDRRVEKRGGISFLRLPPGKESALLALRQVKKRESEGCDKYTETVTENTIRTTHSVSYSFSIE